MTGSDRHILEFLWNGGNALYANPSTISANIDFESNTVRKRVRKLLEVGLLEYYNEESAIYQLTSVGERFLQDELTNEDVAELESEYDRLSDNA